MELYKHIECFKSVKINEINCCIATNIKNEIANYNVDVTRKNIILGILKSSIKYANKYYNSSIECLKFFDNFKEVASQQKDMEFFTYEEYKNLIVL